MLKVIQRLLRTTVGILIFSMLLGMMPLTAWAQTEAMELKDLKVDVWPEYDDPRVLVILQGTFVNTSNQPYSGQVKWNIPKGEIEVGMACEIVDGGGHSCQPYQQVDKGEWTELSWKTTHEIKPGEEYPVFLEYYYNPLKGTTDKSFDFGYQPSYKIGALSLVVKQPLKATNFVIDPVATSTNVDGEGFTNHNYLFNNQTSADKINLKVSYTKTDPAPSVQKQTGEQTSSGGQTGNGLQTTSSYTESKVIIPVVLLLAVLGGFIYYSTNQSKEREKSQRIQRLQAQQKAKQKTAKQSKETRNPKYLEESRKLRQQLINGLITEETYHELMEEIKEDYEE